MNYVCSDIHGRYDRFTKALKHLKSNDKLYILGDVIDRHPDGIKILLEVISNPNIELLMGNHEYMMYRGYFQRDVRWLDIWCYPNNGGDITLNTLSSLPDTTKLQIQAYLQQAKIFQKIVVANKTYMLSHASIVPEFVYTDKSYLRYCDFPDFTTNKAVWGSPFEYGKLYTPLPTLPSNTIVIVGHKYVQHFQDSYKVYKAEPPIIDIDGGCCYPKDYDSKTRLILYRLEDNKEIYIE